MRQKINPSAERQLPKRAQARGAAEKLGDDDRLRIIELARNALAGFESNHAGDAPAPSPSHVESTDPPKEK